MLDRKDKREALSRLASAASLALQEKGGREARFSAIPDLQSSEDRLKPDKGEIFFIVLYS